MNMKKVHFAVSEMHLFVIVLLFFKSSSAML